MSSPFGALSPHLVVQKTISSSWAQPKKRSSHAWELCHFKEEAVEEEKNQIIKKEPQHYLFNAPLPDTFYVWHVCRVFSKPEFTNFPLLMDVSL